MHSQAPAIAQSRAGLLCRGCSAAAAAGRRCMLRDKVLHFPRLDKPCTAAPRRDGRRCARRLPWPHAATAREGVPPRCERAGGDAPGPRRDPRERPPHACNGCASTARAAVAHRIKRSKRRLSLWGGDAVHCTREHCRVATRRQASAAHSRAYGGPTMAVLVPALQHTGRPGPRTPIPPQPVLLCAIPALAKASARSLPGSPACPLTQCHWISCRSTAASNNCHRS